jgi:hypothetical protein
MGRIRLAAVLGVWPCLLGVATADAEENAAARLARKIGLSEAAIGRVAAGEVVVEELEASNDKDLAIALVALVDASVEAVSKAVDAEAFAHVSEVTLSRGIIEPDAFSLADLTLPEELVARLAEKPEKTFYLSAPEVERVTAAASGGPRAALEAYRQVLSDRARAYWEKGDEGIVPYEGEGRSPREDLTDANRAAREVIEGEDTRALLTTPPSKARGPAEHRLAWRVQKGRDQAAPVLSHVIDYRTDGALLFVDRRFYSGYDYDSMLAMVGVLPTEKHDRSVVFYVNHTYTAQVAGFGGGAKRSIGRKLMQKELVAEMERVQAVLQGR